ncbi:MAG: hypothetical protein IT320_19085 [Anaerolineae bacterium]|nr:hypothetical protein [Anaerolineae bacterium]
MRVPILDLVYSDAPIQVRLPYTDPLRRINALADTLLLGILHALPFGSLGLLFDLRPAPSLRGDGNTGLIVARGVTSVRLADRQPASLEAPEALHVGSSRIEIVPDGLRVRISEKSNHCDVIAERVAFYCGFVDNIGVAGGSLRGYHSTMPAWTSSLGVLAASLAPGE